MKLFKLILPVIAAITLNAAEPTNVWTKQDTTLELTFQAVWLMDVLQTYQIGEQARDRSTWIVTQLDGNRVSTRVPVCETNPILGKFPTRKTVTAYFLEVALGHALVTYVLPAKYRPYWHGATIALEVGMVANNYRMGVSVKF